MENSFQYQIGHGVSLPLGISLQNGWINFAIAAHAPEGLHLTIFDKSKGKIEAQFILDPSKNFTDGIWHLSIKQPPNLDSLVYAYQIGAIQLLDPYARSVFTPTDWGANLENKTWIQEFSNLAYFPIGELSSAPTFDFNNDISPQIPIQDLVIYEMHVRGFTQHSSSNVQHPGKFLGIIEKIPHLLELGINAVELLPIQEFDECEYTRLHPQTDKKLYNYWGYSSANFFALMKRYAFSKEPNAEILEFKTLVQELHRNKIELILDVVFNHTGEGNEEGPVYSYKGFDAKSYYMIEENGHYLNFSGCGNSFNANVPLTTDLILNVLKYCVQELHVDGFRFDLAAALNRGPDGTPQTCSAIIQAITEDPVLSKVKLIAEPWDAVGLYQVGSFGAGNLRWTEWNDQYRDTIRRFIKGTPGTASQFSKRISGSEDLFHSRGPIASLNYITAHDGFTLADLVSYNHKHNEANEEQNRDGFDANESWNCGEEGPTSNKTVRDLRERQMRNFHLALMISQGVPMLLMGDEYAHTKQGNNNTWCQDNELNWFLWDKFSEQHAFYRFFRLMIRFRKRHPILRRETFLTRHDVEWHGKEPFKPNWDNPAPFIGLTLKSHHPETQLYIAFNAQNHDEQAHIPPPPRFKTWRWIANTANQSPHDFYEDGEGPLEMKHQLHMQSYSAIILKAV